MLILKQLYLPIYSGFILQIKSASQRPSCKFNVDSVWDHNWSSMFMIDYHLLTKNSKSWLASLDRYF